MEKSLFRQYWKTLCIVITFILVLNTTFCLAIKSDNGGLGKPDQSISLSGTGDGLTPIEYVKSLMDLLKINSEAGTDQSATNVLVYGVCWLLSFLSIADLVIMLLWGIVESIIVTFSKKNRGELNKNQFFGTVAFFTPLLLWIAIFINKMHLNSALPANSGLSVYVEYLAGFNFLYSFIGIMVAYWGGYAIIGWIFDLINRKRSQME